MILFRRYYFEVVIVSGVALNLLALAGVFPEWLALQVAVLSVYCGAVATLIRKADPIS